MSVRRLLRPALLTAIVIGATARCYAPTELMIELDTDLPCTGLTAHVYKGGTAFEEEPAAETNACVADGAVARIGSLLVLPSASRDGRARVRAVLARNGKSPAACTPTDLRDCVVATRAFTFVEHASLRLPIRFLAECVDLACPEDQTCVAGRRCVADSVTCVDGACGLEAERGPPPAVGLDASADAEGGAVDGAPPIACTAPDGSDTLFTWRPSPSALPFTSTAGLTHVFAVLDGLSRDRVIAIPKRGGPTVTAFEIPPVHAGASAGVLALAPDGDGVAVAYRDGTSAYHVRFANDQIVDFPGGPYAIVVAPAGGAIRYYVSAANGVFGWTGASWTLQDPDPDTTSLAADGTWLYMQRTSGGRNDVRVRSRATAGTSTVPNTPRGRAPLATDGASVFLGGEIGDAGPRGAIVTLSGTAAKAIASNLAFVPHSLAVDDAFAYYASGSRLLRVARPAGLAIPTTAALLFESDGGSDAIDHVAASGCLYYWLKTDTATSLKVRAKVP